MMKDNLYFNYYQRKKQRESFSKSDQVKNRPKTDQVNRTLSIKMAKNKVPKIFIVCYFSVFDVIAATEIHHL